jgi:NTP pyrophosphatase (non-canonical NTP hydrolase)
VGEKQHERVNFWSFVDENLERCEADTGFHHKIDEWSPNDWAVAATGELGEMCNYLKKWRRGETVSMFKIADELADTVIYLDLLATRLGLDLGTIIWSKFDRKSREVGSSIFL